MPLPIKPHILEKLQPKLRMIADGGTTVNVIRAERCGALAVDDPVRSLDYVLLSEHVLDPLLGIRDLRTDKRIDFVGGIRGPAELERRVNSGECAVAFALRATTVEQLMRVADAGLIMPPKSTWFEPKLRSGLLIHTLD